MVAPTIFIYNSSYIYIGNFEVFVGIVIALLGIVIIVITSLYATQPTGWIIFGSIIVLAGVAFAYFNKNIY